MKDMSLGEEMVEGTDKEREVVVEEERVRSEEKREEADGEVGLETEEKTDEGKGRLVLWKRDDGQETMEGMYIFIFKTVMIKVYLETIGLLELSVNYGS